jgi:hypothetical protein
MNTLKDGIHVIYSIGQLISIDHFRSSCIVETSKEGQLHAVARAWGFFF